MRHLDLNEIIKASSATKELDTNLISDGYHTFGELYDHRIALFIALARKYRDLMLEERADPEVWKSKKHHDGSSWDGWFIMGIGKERGKQISYHLPISDWGRIECEELEAAPEWDGHTPADVVERLLKL